jgi:hypothetical protein
MTTVNQTLPVVQLVGDIQHPDFRHAIELLRRESRATADQETPPELIVVAQCRPDSIGLAQMSHLRRTAPLAGMIALVGSWCEGETRTGRPWPGAQRLYWYEFPAWWRKQMLLRAAGCCPDWARPVDFGLPAAAGKLLSDCGFSTRMPGRLVGRSGVIVLRTALRETADALADILNGAGYATAWQAPGRLPSCIRGAEAGIWEGGQFSDDEAADLRAFCNQMTRDYAPVLALLDFPRRNRVDHALEIGAAAVLGKPWRNADLLTTIETIAAVPHHARAA